MRPKGWGGGRGGPAPPPQPLHLAAVCLPITRRLATAGPAAKVHEGGATSNPSVTAASPAHHRAWHRRRKGGEGGRRGKTEAR